MTDLQIRPQFLSGGLLAALLLSIYALTFNGTFRVDDEHILAARSQSLAMWGALEEPQVYGNERVRYLALQGDQATQIEPLQSVLGAALYRLGVNTGGAGVQSLFTLNVYLTALSGVVIYAAVLLLGFRRSTALWCALLFGLGSMAWPYAMTFLRDSLAMLMGSIALLGWILAMRNQPRKRELGGALLLSGIALGMLAKNSSAALIPSFLLGASIVAAGIARRRRPIRLPHKAPIILALGLAAGIVLLPKEGALSRYSFSYYEFLLGHFRESLSPQLLPAVLGPFLSPAKSIFLFSPALILAFLPLPQRRSIPREVTVPIIAITGFLALGQALFYREAWAGGFGWGLRFMLPALPGIAVLCAAPVEALLDASCRPLRGLLYGALGVGFAVQIGAVLVPWRLPYSIWGPSGLDALAQANAWEVRFLAIPFQLMAALVPSNWDFALWRMLSAGGSLPWVLAAALVLVTVGALIALRRLQGTATTAIGSLRGLGALALLALFLPIVVLQIGFRGDTAGTGESLEAKAAITGIASEIGAQDLVVLDSYGTPLWTTAMNWWTASVRWYSLPYEVPGSREVGTTVGGPPASASLDLFENLRQDGGRLWYLTSMETPDFSLLREVNWLETNMEPIARFTSGVEGEMEIRVYQGRE